MAAAETGLFILALTLYSVACGLYIGRLAFGLKEGAERAGRLFLTFALAAHSCEIASHCLRGEHPGANVREATSFAAWLVAALAVFIAYRPSSRRLGAGVIAPVIIVLELGARMTPAGRNVATGTTALGRVHIALAMAGVAIFMAATAAAAAYLLRARALKQKRKLSSALERPVMPLEALDGFQHRLATIGFPIFTLALLTGGAWMARLPGGMSAVAQRPQVPMSIVAWAAFAAVVAGRTALGWHGKRTAYLTLLGFLASLLVLSFYGAHAIWSGA